MSDPLANIPAQAPPAGESPTDPNVQQASAEQTDAESTKRDDVRQQLVTWGEELKQQIGVALDQKLDELGARIGQ